MSKGMDLYITAMQEHQAECVKKVAQNNKDQVFIHFIQYLLLLFPIREKLGLMDTENTKGKIKQDTIFGALKNYYEAIKHKDDPDEIYKINIFSDGGVIYPFTYPFVYAPPSIEFGSINHVEIWDKDKKEAISTLHDKHLKGKSIINIMIFATTETLKKYTERIAATD